MEQIERLPLKCFLHRLGIAVEYIIGFVIGFIILSVVWVIVLVVYNLIFEPFDFGPLGSFAIKSAVLITIIAVVGVIPYARWFTLLFWWFGLMIIFKKDFWECRVLVILIWGLNIVISLLLRGIMAA
jgi:hypothetical protein